MSARVSFQDQFGTPGKLYESGIEKAIFGIEIRRDRKTDESGAWTIESVHRAEVLCAPTEDHVILLGVERNYPVIRRPQCRPQVVIWGNSRRKKYDSFDGALGQKLGGRQRQCATAAMGQNVDWPIRLLFLGFANFRGQFLRLRQTMARVLQIEQDVPFSVSPGEFANLVREAGSWESQVRREIHESNAADSTDLEYDPGGRARAFGPRFAACLNAGCAKQEARDRPSSDGQQSRHCPPS